MFIVWGVPYGGASLYDFIRGEGYISGPNLHDFIPIWSYNVWIGLGIVAFLLITFEGAYRLTHNDKPKLKVERELFRGINYALKIINESRYTALNCEGILEMVESAQVDTNTQNQYSWGDGFASHSLEFEDENIISGKRSAILRVINIYIDKQKGQNWMDYYPAYKNKDNLRIGPLPLVKLLFVISLKSEGCSPLYTICYLYNDMNYRDKMCSFVILASNLENHPTIGECRMMLTKYLEKAEIKNDRT